MKEIDRSVIDRAACGDVDAFEEVYRTFSSMVYTLALNITKDRQDAEEVTQDVFVSAFRNLKEFRFGASLKTWFYRVTVNTAINAYHRRSRRGSVAVTVEEAYEVADTAAEDPGRAAVRKDEEARLHEILKGLSPEHRACIALREIEGLDYGTMAETLGVPVNTVRSRLRRARQALVGLMRERGSASWTAKR